MDIFLLEDDDAIALGLTYSLEPEGYQVTRASTVKEAMLLMAERTFSLYILDLTLPDGSGYDVCRKIKEKGDFPVIILTVMEEEVNVVMGLELGADDYITKPFDMEEVLARIESNLRRVQFQNNQTECLQYNNLTLDLEKNTAFLNGIELSLTAKEFGILELLMKYPDKVFSKSNLFQSVWDTEYIAEDNTLNVHISNLRNKLKAICSDTEFIDTVWGIGYRLHKAKD